MTPIESFKRTIASTPDPVIGKSRDRGREARYGPPIRHTPGGAASHPGGVQSSPSNPGTAPTPQHSHPDFPDARQPHPKAPTHPMPPSCQQRIRMIAPQRPNTVRPRFTGMPPPERPYPERRGLPADAKRARPGVQPEWETSGRPLRPVRPARNCPGRPLRPAPTIFPPINGRNIQTQPPPRARVQRQIQYTQGHSTIQGKEIEPFQPEKHPHAGNQRGRHKPHDAICYIGRNRQCDPPAIHPDE
jgi:hypothetical protein